MIPPQCLFEALKFLPEYRSPAVGGEAGRTDGLVLLVFFILSRSYL